ncbi:hypothetical protein O59_003002 [Cellvibrio sp. BR]|uniref:hypothetical protein n=1 Tax=Cellvibrio sp. BR TaxID=1134474 RepID=UPI0002601146|nr:hypothetical protein [Cellvibrio sp. BR]EIK43921.1 hypothetical protein O59_003002 [Cellvibrio sp. BR]
MINLVIKDYTGQAYELAGRATLPRASSAKPYSSDSYSTFRVVARLPVAPDQWMQILNRVHQRLPDLHGTHPGEVYQVVAQAIMRGDLMLYQLPTLNASHALAGKKGVGLSIIKGPKPNSATDLIPEPIKTTDSARQLLDDLGISSDMFLAHLANENLFNAAQKNNALSEALQLLASGELLAYKIPLPPKAPPSKAVEYVAATTADRTVPLAPEVNRAVDKSVSENPGKIDVTALGTHKNSQSESDLSVFVYEEPTTREVALAKSEGSSSFHIQAREKLCRFFLESNGFSESQIANAIGDEVAGIDGGVDLTKPVEIMIFPPPDEMTQYVNSHGFPGNWFDPMSNQTPDALGLSAEGRTLTSFKVPCGKGLLSYSKPIVDNWTNPNNPVSTVGGGKQLFVNDTTKKTIISLNKIGI